MDCRSLGGNKLSGPLPGLDIFHSLRKLWVSHPRNLFRLLIFIITFLVFPISTKWGEEPTLAWTSLNSILSLSGDPPQFPLICILSWGTARNLSDNQFGGLLPDNFGGLNQLTVLDLSHNNFSGTFPPTMANLSSLQQL
jgi:hypothetical protein